MPRIVVRGRDLFSSKLENNGIVCPRMDGEMILRIALYATIITSGRVVSISESILRKTSLNKNRTMSGSD
jgi:hypothetical protein